MSADITEISRDSIEPSAFAERYRDSYQHLWLIATAIIGDATFAEDILQEAAVIGLQKLDQYRAGTNLVAWMATIVRNCALNYARKTRNRGTVPMDPLAIDGSVAGTDSAASLDEVMAKSGDIKELQTEFGDDVVKALMAIDDIPRCCVLLRIVGSLSYEDISGMMDIPQGTAMSHVHRAKQSMRNSLERVAPGKNTPQSSRNSNLGDS